MKLYRLKHKPTGLYLKNGGKLSKKGHVYSSGINTLNCDKNDTIRIMMAYSMSSKKDELYYDKMDSLYGANAWHQWNVPKTDFEKEIIAEL